MDTVTLLPTDSIQALARELEAAMGTAWSDRRVAVKLHMGEYGNLHYLRPSIVGRVVEVLKARAAQPYLLDTPVLYGGPRGTPKGYLDAARKNGFSPETMGCPIVISERYSTVDSQHHIGSIEIPSELVEADGMLVLTHFKGHPDAAFGGSIKNLGMGCVSIETKRKMHKQLSAPLIHGDKCTQCLACVEKCPWKALVWQDDRPVLKAQDCYGCGACSDVCPAGAIVPAVANLRELLAEAAALVLAQFKAKPVLFVNALLDMTELCDCTRRPGKRIAEDIGYLISGSAAAVDKASVDQVNAQLGKDFFAEHYPMDPQVQLQAAARLGLGELEYRLVTTEQKR